MAMISRWIVHTRPALMVVDVSVEVALLARLHGVPVVAVVLPGRRDDPAHRLVHDLADTVIGLWPDWLAGVVSGPDAAIVEPLGALSRFDDRIGAPAKDPQRARRVTVLGGTGGTGLDSQSLAWLRSQTPQWEWTSLTPGSADWTDDPWPILQTSAVIVSHAGEHALAEVAASRRPAVLIPQDRPHDEQRTLGRAIARDGRLPVIVRDGFGQNDWLAMLERVALFDGEQWARWNDGRAAERLVAVLRSRVACNRP